MKDIYYSSGITVYTLTGVLGLYRLIHEKSTNPFLFFFVLFCSILFLSGAVYMFKEYIKKS